MATKAEKNRAWKAANPDKVRVNARRYYAKNREAILARDKARREAASPEQRATQAAYFRTRYLAQKAAHEAQRPSDILEQLTDAESAYMAGIIDGEGCYSLTVHLGYPLLHLTVANTHLGLIEWLAAKWGTRLHVHRPPPKAHWRQQYTAKINGARAVALSRRLLPWLIVKREQARIALAWGETLGYRRGRAVALPASLLAQRFALKAQLEAINRGHRLADPPDDGELPKL